MTCCGWIIGAFLIGYLVACEHKKCATSLQVRLFAVERFNGRSYCEILRMAHAWPVTAHVLPNGTTIRVWKEACYSIALKFDRQSICEGVVEQYFP